MILPDHVPTGPFHLKCENKLQESKNRSTEIAGEYCKSQARDAMREDLMTGLSWVEPMSIQQQ